jgi:pilus assembly protein Flp/PilA
MPWALPPTLLDDRLLAMAVRFAVLRGDRRGVTAVEYGLIAAGIAAVIVVAVLTMGGQVGAMFEETEAAVGAM